MIELWVFRFCKKKKAIRISHTKIFRNLLLVKWLLRTKPSISVINQRKCKNGRYMFCDQNKDYQKSGIVCCDWRPNKHLEHISVFIDLYILIWNKMIIPTFFYRLKEGWYRPQVILVMELSLQLQNVERMLLLLDPVEWGLSDAHC